MTFSSTSFHSLIKYVVKRPISGYILVILLAVQIMVTFIAVHIILYQCFSLIFL